MLDPKVIRDNPDKIRKVVQDKGVDPQRANVDRWLDLDEQRKKIVEEIERINRRRNQIAETLSSERNQDLVNEGRLLKEKERALKENLDKIEQEWQEILSWIPNIPFDNVRSGRDETENEEIYAWIPGRGELPKENLGLYQHSAQYMPIFPVHASEEFEPKHHIELFEALGFTDMRQAAKVSGTRFYYLIGDIVKLQRALHEFVLKKLDSIGFTRIIPPLLVKEEVLFGTSHFPEGRDQVYEIRTDYIEEKNPLFLVGSSEPSNFAFAMDKTFSYDQLPLRLVAITPCFRSEVGSWGKDVRGIKRAHQFDKLEMDVVCLPEQSEQIYEELLEINKWLLKELELPFHIIQKCTGDSGYNASAKQADVEVWLPSQKTFMEVGTNTNTTDYQARRLRIKFADRDGEVKYAHTVNDTGVSDRMLIAIAEHYQQKDGSIKVPKVLVDLVGKEYLGKN